MSPNPIRSTLFTSAAVALVLVTSAALATDATIPEPNAAPIIVAQASTSVVPTATPAGKEDLPHLRGIRKAATESPEALRRYIWRTRMIYNFRYNDFAPKE